MGMIKFLAVAAAAFWVAGCCACRRSGNVLPLTGTEWRLTQLGSEAVVSDAGFRMTLGDDGRITGIGDCNRFNGSFDMRAGSGPANGTLSVGRNLVSTRMMCPDQARETAFLRMLGEVDSWSIDGQRLLLLKGGDVLAIFEPAATPAAGERTGQ